MDRFSPEVLAPPPEIADKLPNPKVMSKVHAAARFILHPRVEFEEGAAEALAEHEAAGGSLLILMTHFKRWEVVMMADIANEKPLRHIRLNTGITARKELFDLPYGAGYVVRNSGSQAVGRSIESPNETEEESKARKNMNKETQATGALFLENGYHWLIFPEGGSKQIIVGPDGRALIGEDGKIVREERRQDELLPLQRGFVDTLDALSPEARKRVKILGIVARYGTGKLAGLHPKIVVTRPESPVEGTLEDKLLQGKNILQRGLDQVIALDN